MQQAALLASSVAQSSRVMVLVEEGIFAEGVVNIKAPSIGQPPTGAKCLYPGKG